MTEAIPSSMVEALDGYPEVGVADAMIPLLTVDEAGYPHVCLLSRAELNADSSHVYAVVASPVTKSNLLRDRRATLVVFTPRSANYAKLDANGFKENGHLMGIVFDLHSMKEDGNESFHMEVPRYMPTDEIATMEHWDLTRALLADLQSSPSEV